MSRETLEGVVRWQNALGDTDGLEITFHGGEPLVPGIQFYSMALPLLRQGLAPRRVRFAMQTNLWLLTGELCDLFREHGVSLGASLDGPEPINDTQRGKGYFQRTMAGIERARKHGLDAGGICTFTAQSAPHAQEIFDFFVRERLNFSIHAAAPPLRHPDAEGWSIPPEAHGQLLADMLEHYLANLDKIRISTLDAMCRSVSNKCGSICTFTDCLGGHLAVAPDGTIHPCQRFAGTQEYQLGNVHDGGGQTVAASPVWARFQAWQEHINNECKGCPHLDYCRGGCQYNALAANGGHFNGSGRDPRCPSFQSEILRLLASHRDPESYVAGSTPLNRSTSRFSGDIDIFHDREERVRVAAELDSALLQEHGFALRWHRRDPLIYTAFVERGP